MANSEEHAYVGHLSPGRLRVKIPSRKGDTDFFSSIQLQLSGLPGIESVNVNPLTGSVLLIHSTDAHLIIDYAGANNFFTIKKLETPSSDLYQEVSKVYNNLDGQTKGLLGGGINVASLASVALIIAGVYQISVGNLTALPWYVAIYYGIEFFLKSKPMDKLVEPSVMKSPSEVLKS